MDLETYPQNSIKYPQTKFRLQRRVKADIERFLSNLRSNSRLGLHLGSGGSKLQGLINCDLFDPRADLAVDATNLSSFDDNSVDLIESHHMIEHLSFVDTESALGEWQRVLCPGGLIILTFPDISAISIQWLFYSLIYPFFPKPDKLDYIVKMFVGSQEHKGMFHNNAFDLKRMDRILTEFGFSIDFTYFPYPKRPTPSRLVIARKLASPKKIG